MADSFYHSDGVLHPIPACHHERTFQALMDKSPYARAYIIEHQGQIAGYGLLALTYSNEAGGIVVWIDELYIKPEFRGLGIGGKFIRFVKNEHKNAARLRLELEPQNEGARRLYRREGFVDLGYEQMSLERPG